MVELTQFAEPDFDARGWINDACQAAPEGETERSASPPSCAPYVATRVPAVHGIAATSEQRQAQDDVASLDLQCYVLTDFIKVASSLGGAQTMSQVVLTLWRLLVHRYLAELEMKLQLLSEDVEASLADASSRALQRIPLAVQEVSRIKAGFTLLSLPLVLTHNMCLQRIPAAVQGRHPMKAGAACASPALEPLLRSWFALFARTCPP